MMNFISNIGEMLTPTRSILRTVEDCIHLRRRVRIVVLGSKESGKTVFLTALANHLLHHDPTRFDLNGWEAFPEEESDTPESVGFPPFPYADFRAGFAQERPEWPEKTKSTSVLRLPLRLRKQGKRDRRLLLEFLDLPGERIADLTMARRSFREWSQWMNDSFAGQMQADPAYRNYLRALQDCSSPDDAFSAYKQFLRIAAESFSPWIVPSIVKLPQDQPTGRWLDVLEDRPLGLDASSQFIPLPESYFDKTHPLHEWAVKFERAYDEYRAQIVSPIVDWLREADHLLYLVDVLNILKSGTTAYNMERKFGEAVLNLSCPPKAHSVPGSILQYFESFFLTRLRSAHIVVTKADLAAESDRERLRSLARDLFGKNLRGQNLSGGWSIANCAAVDTIQYDSDETGEKQRAWILGPDDSWQSVDFHFPTVPEHWPRSDEWDAQIKAGMYWSEKTLPVFDGKENAPPPQNGLDDRLKDVLADLLPTS